MSKLYFNQSYVVLAAQVLQVLGSHKVLTLSQINARLPSGVEVTASDLNTAVNNGWLLRQQPGNRYQSNPSMIYQNWRNALIASFVPGQVYTDSAGLLPSTYVQGMGITTASRQDIKACVESGELEGLVIPPEYEGEDFYDPLSLPPAVAYYSDYNGGATGENALPFPLLRVCSSAALKKNIQPLMVNLADL